jgi:hypothetical protein
VTETLNHKHNVIKKTKIAKQIQMGKFKILSQFTFFHDFAAGIFVSEENHIHGAQQVSREKHTGFDHDVQKSTHNTLPKDENLEELTP